MGGEFNLSLYKIADFWLETDPNGLKYLCIERDELTKNHHTDNDTAGGRMFEIKGTVLFDKIDPIHRGYTNVFVKYVFYFTSEVDNIIQLLTVEALNMM